jgi:Uma2 family endonuclease
MEDEHTSLTFREYLQLERSSAVRHEYIAGELFEMGNLSPEHDAIAVNLSSELQQRLREGDCEVFMGEMILWVEATQVAYYPDVMVVCDPTDSDRDFKTRPILIIEVLSCDTVATDRQEKFRAYQKLPSLQEYLLVHQDKVGIEVLRKNAQGNWTAEHLHAKDKLRLHSLQLTLTMAEIYEGVLLAERSL